MRYPIVAGSFYPGTESELAQIIKTFPAKSDDSIAVHSPHAGYLYSGPTAAKACSALGQADTYILLGPNHRCNGSILSVSRETWQTPLGELETNQDIANTITEKTLARIDETSHDEEHSIEVQLPFLQTYYKNFKIVPISIMAPPIIPPGDFAEICKELGETIAKIVKSSDKKIKLLCSGDFSHHIPESTAKEIDMDLIASIKELNADKYLEKVLTNNPPICGIAATATTILAAKALGAKKAELIEYTSSAPATGPQSVVGYAALRYI